MQRFSLIVLCSVFALAVGCTSKGADEAPPGPNDAGVPPDDAAGRADAGAPPAPTLPQAVSIGGPIVKNPKIVPVVWTSDPLAAEIDTWLAAWEKTTYWGDMVAEYGIGKATLRPTIHTSEALPDHLGDTAIRAWLASRLDGTHPEYPALEDGTFFLLVYPPGTTITLAGGVGTGTSCTDFHGFHDEAPVGTTKVPFAVISRCDGIPEAPVTGIQYVAAVTSHEVLEGLADPFPLTDAAYAAIDDAHSGWQLGTGAEIGDLCALQGNAFFQPNDFPYTVQKIWSNVAAKAGRDPCVPERAGEPYFLGIPRMAKDGSVKIALGKSAQIVVDVYADGPVPTPITLKAQEILENGHLKLSFDRSAAMAGETVTLTIESLTASQLGQEPFLVAATSGTRRNLAFGVVSH